MLNAITHLNYLAVLVTAVAGFMLGWLWYSPILFAKAWMAEMKITEATMKAAAETGMAKYLGKSFLFTLMSTFGLAALITAHASAGALRGALFGAFAAVFVSAPRLLNTSVWENRSARLLAINVGHEFVLFTLQGAILGVWR